jgi:hypothetical protein
MKTLPRPIRKINYTEFQELMRIHKHTNKSLAPLCGFTPQALGNWINQGKPMPGEVIIRIRDIFQLAPGEVDWLLLGGPRPVQDKTVNQIVIDADELVKLIRERRAI